MTKRRLPDELMFIENSRAIQKTTTASMAGKVCVVSGATSGVGLAAVKRLARGGAQIVMVCDDHVHAARVGIINRFMRSDTRVACDDELGPVINDRTQALGMDAMTLFAADRDVRNNVRAQ